jgi:DNA-binding NarL/FixJ family response regulator
MSGSISTLIADDHPLFRAGIRSTIEEDTTISIIGEADNGADALKLIEQLSPAVAVLDIQMPKMTGLEVAESLSKNDSSTRVIILTMHDQAEFLDRAMELSVKGYILKDCVESEIVNAIHAVSAGKYYFSPDLSDRVIQQTREVNRPNDFRNSLEVLTKREREIVSLVASGMTSKEIAEQLFLSLRTVDNHRTHICNKLSLTGSFALLKFAVEHKEDL